ncbi:MAG: hypothetical protein B193_0246, partial [Solidesulfovibrio magneticus str. Maddingley MBC34]
MGLSENAAQGKAFLTGPPRAALPAPLATTHAPP